MHNSQFDRVMPGGGSDWIWAANAADDAAEYDEDDLDEDDLDEWPPRREDW
jgi:hypothetical protein